LQHEHHHKTASTGIILAVDLGKYKSVACVHDQDSSEIRFTSFETTRAELQRLLAREQPAVVVIEACLLAGWVHDLCSELGCRCLVANTASEAWKFKHLKRKTDKDDALRLAQLYLLEQLPTVTLPPTSVRQWRSLIACRPALVGRSVAVQNRSSHSRVQPNGVRARQSSVRRSLGRRGAGVARDTESRETRAAVCSACLRLFAGSTFQQFACDHNGTRAARARLAQQHINGVAARIGKVLLLSAPPFLANGHVGQPLGHTEQDGLRFRIVFLKGYENEHLDILRRFVGVPHRNNARCKDFSRTPRVTVCNVKGPDRDFLFRWEISQECGPTDGVGIDMERWARARDAT
jgi:hypothetical protein